MKRRGVLSFFIGVLLLYGSAMTIYTAAKTGDTFDEPNYRAAGLRYLIEHRFDDNHDHPPLSKWVAALYPKWSGSTDIRAYRVSHVLFFSIGGAWICVQLTLWDFPIAALIFALLYSLSPDLKAMASINGTDSDCAIAMTILALYCWRGFRERATVGVFFLQGLVANFKITGLAYLPFSLLRLWELRSGKAKRWACLGFFLALLFCYHFVIMELGWYAASIGFQAKHNVLGHLTFLLGKTSTTGFWFFYPVLFFLKTPLSSLVLILGGFIPAILVVRKQRTLWEYLILPAVLMVCALSVARVQLGYRYALPALLLVFLAVSLAWDDFYKNRAPRTRLRLAYGFALLALGATVTDYRTATQDAYLAYFNPLAPEPTRNFCGSNNDWGQGIPAHLQSTVPAGQPIEKIATRDALLGRGSISITEGATALCGDWSREAPLLRAFEPVWKGAGYEIFSLTPPQFFTFLKIYDQTAEVDLRGYSKVSELQNRLSENCANGIRIEPIVGKVRLRLDPGKDLVLVKSDAPAFWKDSMNPQLSPKSMISDASSVKSEWRAWPPVHVIEIVDGAGAPLLSAKTWVIRQRCPS